MALKPISGTINSIAQGANISGTITQRGGTITTRNVWSFRINNTPVSLSSKENLSFSEGDKVVAVGKFKSGTFQIVCVKNETTGAIHIPSSNYWFIWGVIIFLFGVLTVKFVLGIIFIFMGELMILLGFQVLNATKYFNKILNSKRNDDHLLDIENQGSGESLILHWVIASAVFVYFIYKVILVLFPPNHHTTGGGWM